MQNKIKSRKTRKINRKTKKDKTKKQNLSKKLKKVGGIITEITEKQKLKIKKLYESSLHEFSNIEEINFHSNSKIEKNNNEKLFKDIKKFFSVHKTFDPIFLEVYYRSIRTGNFEFTIKLIPTVKEIVVTDYQGNIKTVQIHNGEHSIDFSKSNRGVYADFVFTTTNDEGKSDNESEDDD